MDIHISGSSLRDSLSLLTSDSYKNHRFYQPYLDSCFFVFDYRFLSLSFSQFHISLLLLLRKNFSTGQSIISESISPLPESIPDSRLEYIFKSLQTKGIIKKHSKNIFNLLVDDKGSIKLPYSYLLNTIIYLNEENCNYFKLLLYYSFTRMINLSSIQHTFHIRKSTSCAIYKIFQENKELIDSLLISFSKPTQPLNRSSSLPKTSSHFLNQKCFSFTPIVPDSVPFSSNLVPDSSLKYVFNNNINNQSNLSTSAIKWAIETTDRFIIQNDFKTLLNISEPSESFCSYLCLLEDLKKTFSKDEYSVISALSTVARLQSYFSSFNDIILFKSVSEVFLTIRDAKYSSPIKNLKAYFFKSLRNALTYSKNHYPRLQKLIDKQTLIIDQKQQTLKTTKIDEIEDKIYEDSIIAFERECGRNINGLFDPEFANFYSNFRSRISSEKENLAINLKPDKNESNEDDLIEASFDRKKNYYELNYNYKINKYNSFINNVLNESMYSYSNHKYSKCNSDIREAVKVQSNSRRSNIMIRLIKGREISSDEYSFLPIHIQQRCEHCGINTEGEALYKLKKNE